MFLHFKFKDLKFYKVIRKHCAYRSYINALRPLRVKYTEFYYFIQPFQTTTLAKNY